MKRGAAYRELPRRECRLYWTASCPRLEPKSRVNDRGCAAATRLEKVKLLSTLTHTLAQEADCSLRGPQSSHAMDSSEPPAGANAVEAVKQYNRVRASTRTHTRSTHAQPTLPGCSIDSPTLTHLLMSISPARLAPPPPPPGPTLTARKPTPWRSRKMPNNLPRPTDLSKSTRSVSSLLS